VHYAVGGIDLWEDRRVFLDMLADALTQTSLLERGEVTYDFDSMFGVSVDLPLNSAGYIMPVPDQRLVLKKSIHLSHELSTDDADMPEVSVVHSLAIVGSPVIQLYRVDMHKIPNIPFLEVEQRHLTRIMLPHSRARDDKDRTVPGEIMAEVWNIIRPIIIHHQPSEDSYLPATFDMEKIRQTYTGNSARPLNARTIADIGPEIIEALRSRPFGREAFFLHQWRGTRGATGYTGQADHAPVLSLSEFTSCLDRDKIIVADWAIDMGMTIQIGGHVLLWRRDGLPKIVEAVYRVDNDTAQKIVNSTRFIRDEEAQLDAISGFRHEPDRTTQQSTGVLYAQAYHTIKEPTYNIPELTYKQVSQDAGGKYIENIRKIYDGANQMLGSARLEMRVGLEEVGRRMLPVEALAELLVLVPASTWW
jgi:hypothetical protein